MERKEDNRDFGRKVKRAIDNTWRFLRKTFSDKKNMVRFVFAAVAVIITSQLMPGITIASFWVAFLLVLLMIALLIAARPTIDYVKLPFHLAYYGIFIWLSYFILLLFLDWILWYFETLTVWWVLLYCMIQAVFNCIIENLLQEE